MPKYVYTLKAQRKGVAKKYGDPVPADTKDAKLAELLSGGFITLAPAAAAPTPAPPAAAKAPEHAAPKEEAKPTIEDASMSGRGRKP